MITYFFEDYWNINDKDDENAQLSGIAIVRLSEFFGINFGSEIWNKFCLEVLTRPNYPRSAGLYLPSINGKNAKIILPEYSPNIENRETAGHEASHFLHELVNPDGFFVEGVVSPQKLYRECIATIGEKRFTGMLKGNQYDAQRLIRLKPSEVYEKSNQLFKIRKELTN
jgi:hypothetical protein